MRFAKEQPKSFPFFFVDPTGWEPLQIDVIAPILSMNPGEVLITLMTSWITRFLSDQTKGFHRLLGAEVPRILQLDGEDQEEESSGAMPIPFARQESSNMSAPFQL